MSTSRLSPNSICACGSNLKYKKCCEKRNIEYRIDDQTNAVTRNVTLSAEVAAMLDEQRNRFIKDIGRVPGPNDPLFFDAASLGHLERPIIEFLEATGTDPAQIYAFERTGIIVSDMNREQFTELQENEWIRAIEEYNKMHNRIAS